LMPFIMSLTEKRKKSVPPAVAGGPE